MFWQTKQVSSPHLEALLNREDCTIYDLMDDEDILQECKSQNKKLLEFLTRPNVMDELITLMIHNPTIEIAESHRYKYPHIACEILSCDIPMFNEKLAGLRHNISKRNVKQLNFWMRIWKMHGIKMWCKEGDVGLLEKLYSFIDTEEPLNPLLASFFSKAMGILVVRSKDQNWYSYQFTCLQVLAFLKSREKCIDLLMYHLETSAIMNLVLKLVTEVEGADTRQNILDWLDSQQLVQRLVKLLSPHCEPSRHSNAAELLSDIIDGVRDIRKNSSERSVESDPILCTLESEETTTLLLDTILVEEKLESSIVGGIQVLLTLLKQKNNGNSNEQNRSNSEEAAEAAIKLKISNATIPYLQKFHDLLLNPPYMPPVKTTIGILDVPVGNTRLHILKLFATLLSVDNPNIRAKLVELDIFQTFLDLFFKYPWNNFLHAQVQHALGEALGSIFPESDKSFYEHIFMKCRLINKILEAYAANDVVKSGRLGYMGHLIEITNDIALQCEKNNVLNTFITTNLSQETVENWQILVSKDLKHIKTLQQTLSAPRHMADSDSNNSEYNYSQDVYGQQVQMDPHYIEIYEYRNEVFKGEEEPILSNNSSDQSGSIMLNAEDQTENEEMFNKLCECREQPNDSAWWSEDVAGVYRRDERSSSSEEEDDNEKDEEEGTVDFWKAFPNVNTLQPDPWDMNAPTQSDSDNWANFATNWPGENETANTDIPGEKVNDAGWACFANFDSALSFAKQENEDITTKIEVTEAPVEDEAIKKQNNSIKETVEEEQDTKQNVDLVQTSDDDNANPILMIENRISEITEDKSCDENVQNTVETVNYSSDGNSLVNTIENNGKTVNEST